MEPLSALGLASSIAQFIDFGFKLISESHELYHTTDGALKENIDLEEVAADLQRIALPLMIDQSKLPRRPSLIARKDEGYLSDLANKCFKTSEELVTILQGLRVRKDIHGNASAWLSIRQALRTRVKSSKISELERRLHLFQSQLNTRLLSSLSNSQSSTVHALNEISYEGKKLGITTTNLLEELKETIVDMLQNKDTINDRVVMSDLSERLEELATGSKRTTREHAILTGLYFDQISIRQSKIKPAHAATFRWAFDDSKIKLRYWLSAGNGPFWITGKAGSGKSTFMKFICDHELTLDALKQWGGEKEVITAEFFFWNSGTPMQKSQEGLLQAMLFQVLSKAPALIEKVCPKRMNTEIPSKASSSWTLKELIATFNTLATQKDLSSKFCFFIDGLDEYDTSSADDEHEDLALMLKRLCASPNIKICVSSRPWSVFETELGETQWKVYMQHHTKEDIRKYTSDILGGDERFKTFRDTEPRSHELMANIAQRAQGVFLWVFLAVKSLLRGLRERNDIRDLQARLDELPDDLEEYFAKMFKNIDKFNRPQAARILLVAVEAYQPLPLLAFAYIEEERRKADYALKKEVSPISYEGSARIYSRMKQVLDARGRDLLEIHIQNQKHPIFAYKVEFLHRTVRDFLRTPDMERLLKREAQTFDARVSICRCYLAMIKSLPLEDGMAANLNDLFTLVDEMMHYTREVEAHSGTTQVALLDELDHTIAQLDTDDHWTNFRDPVGELYEEYGRNDFLAFCIQSGQRRYVQQKLEQRLYVLKSKQGRPLLDYALRPNMKTPAQIPSSDQKIDPDMVRLLLDYGANPNQTLYIYDKRTPWGLFLEACYATAGIIRGRRDSRRALYETVELLITRGADLDVRCVVPGSSTDLGKKSGDMSGKAPGGKVTVSLERVVEHTFSFDEARRLRQIIERERQARAFSIWKWVSWVL